MRWSLLLLLVTMVSCRDKQVAPKADPVVVDASKPDTSPPSIKPEVTTNRIELPRKGHPAVVLELPVVKGVPSADVVNELLSAEKILGYTLDDVKKDAKAANPKDVPFGVQAANYTVLFNAHEVLEIDASVETLGAYPSTQRFHALIDVRKGVLIGKEAFLAARIPALVKRLEAMRAAETKAAIAKEPSVSGFVGGAHFEEKDLADFSIGPKGITFNYDYGFPHVAQAIQPDGRFLLTWSDLAADIDPSGPLARARPG